MNDVCARCGEAHARCTAHNRAGKACGKHPATGLTVCATHGGSAPHAKAAGLRRAAEQEALKAVTADASRTLAHSASLPLENPLDQLALLAREVLAFKDALAGRVNAMNGLRFTDDKGAEQLRSEIALYERALDRAQKVLAELVKLGYDKRRIELAEEQGRLIADVMRRIFADLDLTPEQAAAAPAIAATHLRLLSA